MPLNATQTAILERGLKALRTAPPEDCAMQDFTCGTAHCIGGWLAVANQMTITQVTAAFDWTDYWSSPISDLLYMWGHSLGTFDFRPAEERKKLMIMALENFIRTGSPNWSTILDQEVEAPATLDNGTADPR